jgi:hypothetical protein
MLLAVMLLGTAKAKDEAARVEEAAAAHRARGTKRRLGLHKEKGHMYEVNATQ